MPQPLKLTSRQFFFLHGVGALGENSAYLFGLPSRWEALPIEEKTEIYDYVNNPASASPWLTPRGQNAVLEHCALLAKHLDEVRGES